MGFSEERRDLLGIFAINFLVTLTETNRAQRGNIQREISKKKPGIITLNSFQCDQSCALKAPSVRF